jgi:hypothetical protein
MSLGSSEEIERSELSRGSSQYSESLAFESNCAIKAFIGPVSMRGLIEKSMEQPPRMR